MYENWKIKKSDLFDEKQMEKLQKEQSEVANWCNQNQQYRISDDEEYIFVEKIPEPTAEELAEMEIARLKRYLADTDYISNKLIEAVDDSELQDLKEKYAGVISERRKARARISELEG